MAHDGPTVASPAVPLAGTLAPPGTPRKPIHYPDSDGKPMAENTKQARWIFTLYGNLSALFRDSADVFVAADNLWYPVEGEVKERQAPDVYVVFGRPKGDRGSYKQWEEGGVPLTVVFEILSPGNDVHEMADKLDFYDRHGVEEYHVYDPDRNRLMVYLRGQAALRRILQVDGFVSPRLGIRFDLSGPEMVVRYPDGRPFLTFEELEAQARTTEQRARRLAELGRRARRGQASAEELRELDQLEAELLPDAGPPQ